MAGFDKVYFVGQEGGFMGADGVGSVALQIFVYSGSRQWLEPYYFDPSIKPLGQITTIIPDGPDSPNALLDACLAFYPDYFESCPSLAGVKKEAKNLTSLDFDLGTDEIPASWNQLRSEAQPLFKELGIWEANLVPVKK